MVTYVNPINLGSLASKSSPVAADIVGLLDSASNNALKQCTITQLVSGNIGTTQAAGDNSLKLATTAYADRMVPLAGGTMTGLLVLSADPSAALGAATKQYVDSVSAGLTIKQACVAATTTALTATYANGAAGVGATLTNAGAMAAFALDGVSLSVNDRVLIKDQASTFQNGIYTVTTVGSGAVNWVLTRATDYDTAAEIKAGTLIPVNQGTTNALTSWLETATVTTVGTDPVVFSQFTASPTSFANYALSNLSSVAINTSLLPGSDASIDLGSAAKRWRNALVQTVQTGTTNGDTTLLQAYNTSGSYTTFATLTAGATPTMALSSAVTGATQAANTNNTTLATTAYADTSAGTRATKALDNLASVAINTSLLPGTDDSIDLGSAAKRWKNALVETVQTGTTNGNTVLLQAYNTSGSYTTFATLTAGATPTMALASAVTGVTQSASDNSNKLATTAYADRMVPLAGGTMTGLLVLSADPSAALGAATKQYVDSVAQGLTIQGACLAATTATLNATYANGVSGVGATLTNAGALAAFSVDGVSPALNSRILVKNQSSSLQNGIYTLTTVGSGAVAWILTRATDYDQASEINPGDLVLVQSGTANAVTSWMETATVATIGTDAITFSQFTASPSSYATTSLGNLASVAINTALLPASDSAIDLGSAAFKFRNALVKTVQTGTTNADTVLLQAYNTGTTSYTTMGTLTASATPTFTVTITGGTITGITDITVADGGTGVSTFNTAYSVVCAGTSAAGPLQNVAPSATALPLVSGGTSALPSFTGLTVAGGGTGVTTLTTAYGVLCAGTTATGAVQTLSSLGTSGQVLTSNGAGALPSFQAASGSSGSYVFISSATASSSATIDFTGLSSTYSEYVIEMENVVPSTDATTLYLLYGTGGTPTYETTSYHCDALTIYSAGTYSDDGVTNGSQIQLSITGATFTLGNGTGEAWSGSIKLIMPSGGLRTHGTYTASNYTNSPVYGYVAGSFWRDNATAVTALRFKMSSGNLSSGTFRLYGIKSS